MNTSTLHKGMKSIQMEHSYFYSLLKHIYFELVCYYGINVAHKYNAKMPVDKSKNSTSEWIYLIVCSYIAVDVAVGRYVK